MAKIDHHINAFGNALGVINDRSLTRNRNSNCPPVASLRQFYLTRLRIPSMAAGLSSVTLCVNDMFEKDYEAKCKGGSLSARKCLQLQSHLPTFWYSSQRGRLSKFCRRQFGAARRQPLASKCQHQRMLVKWDVTSLCCCGLLTTACETPSLTLTTGSLQLMHDQKLSASQTRRIEQALFKSENLFSVVPPVAILRDSHEILGKPCSYSFRRG